jgi:hypothetical protein
LYISTTSHFSTLNKSLFFRRWRFYFLFQPHLFNQISLQPQIHTLTLKMNAASRFFPSRSYWEPIRPSGEEVAERVQAYKHCDAHPKRDPQTDTSLYASSVNPAQPFRTQIKASEFKVAMRDKEFKWWNAPPKTNPKSKLEAAKSGKLELHVPSVEALDIDAPFLSPSRDSLRSFRAASYQLERDRLFKLYNRNGRSKVSVGAHDTHYLNHNTHAKLPAAEPKEEKPSAEAEMIGTWWSRVVRIVWKTNWTLFWACFTWIGVFITGAGMLFWGMEPVAKPVLAFISQWIVEFAFAWWFLSLLALLII